MGSDPNFRPVALTSGEPAGIGPDLCLMLASRELSSRFVVLGDPDVLAARAKQLGLRVEQRIWSPPARLEPRPAGVLDVLPVRASAPVVPGRLDSANAAYVLEMLREAVELCTSGACSALVTAPVQKSVIAESGVPFSGHTELLAELTGAELPVMLLAGPKLRVALLTTHLPLRGVPDAITGDRIERTVAVVHRDLSARFRIAQPRILVLGLNPHAGEGGTLGTEERDVIAPAIRRLAERGYRVLGPVSADTAFTPVSLARCDVVLAMYHDQGLPVLKASSFGEIVNVTLGLPIVRTSVDHGTALDLAGTGLARVESLGAALRLADELVRRSRSEPLEAADAGGAR
ncbi:MAG TPA: 4-hydroxythreonine-4-phosphate dehydrogenase PdxA [Gammaproteobacteria bacterium]|nr:4-hydroxythreonine-4-phosphate dehydrogenase PdxA [Gammaproteobacteria bacterium]